MNEWVTLSPQQRAQARLNFARTKELSKQLTPEEKKAKWQTYQALSPEEKQKLAAKASPKPVGAATAVKPVAPQKLAARFRRTPPKPRAKLRLKSALHNRRQPPSPQPCLPVARPLAAQAPRPSADTPPAGKPARFYWPAPAAAPLPASIESDTL
jgi:hypothetical protein